jgi:hypothetical protein
LGAKTWEIPRIAVVASSFKIYIIRKKRSKIVEKIQEGVFRADLSVNVLPGQIQYTQWMIPGTLGRVELEDIAARFVGAACRHDGWVGLTVKYIGAQVINEIDAAIGSQDTNNTYVEETWRYQDKMRTRRILSILTLGIYALLKPAPIAPVKPQKQELPYSPLAIFCRIQGPDKFHYELQQMLEKGWLKTEMAEEGQVFFPTEALISRLPIASKN